MKVKPNPKILDKIIKNELKKLGYYDLNESNSTNDILNKFDLLNKGTENAIKWIKNHQNDR